jgi:hypothetical protein
MGMPNKVVGGMRERLAAAMETTGELRQNQSELLRMMRQTLSEIRALRQRLLSPVDDGANASRPVPEENNKKPALDSDDRRSAGVLRGCYVLGGEFLW